MKLLEEEGYIKSTRTNRYILIKSLKDIKREIWIKEIIKFLHNSVKPGPVNGTRAAYSKKYLTVL